MSKPSSFIWWNTSIFIMAVICSLLMLLNNDWLSSLFGACTIYLSCLALWNISQPFKYTEKCPRCHNQAQVTCYGSEDQIEDVNCNCGYKIKRII